MANLIIDIGNTALKAAWADGVTLGKTFRYQGERTMDFILSITAKEKPEVMVVSTVREMTKRNENLLRQECSHLIMMDSRNRSVSENNGIPAYLSPDRAASIIAARYLFKGSPVTIFDCGTILTTDYLDSEGNYEGGSISPGCMTRFKSVNRYSNRSLPLLLEMPEETEEKSTSLEDSIKSGIISGIMFEIRGRMDSHPENICVFTGGDAIYFVKRLKNSIFVVCNLVLMGLALVADRYE